MKMIPETWAFKRKTVYGREKIFTVHTAYLEGNDNWHGAYFSTKEKALEYSNKYNGEVK